MSRTLAGPRWGLSAAVAGALALLLMALAAVCFSTRAEAAFTSGKCAGADIVGRGASFARDAHNVFINNFQPIYCAGTPALAGVTYEALGSGSGRESVRFRDKAPRFGMSDEAPTVAEIAQMNAGTGNAAADTDANPNDNGKIHVIPAAVGAVAPLVNFPNDCDVNLLNPESKTAEVMGGTAPNEFPLGLVRVRFSKTEYENVWAKNPAFDEWDEVFPELEADLDCQKPIIRVVRFDESGTSFAFKDYLNSIDGAEGWLTTFASGANKTREWPNATFGARADCPGKNGPGSQDDLLDQLTSGCDNGNGELVKKVVSTDGSIGYSDVSTARSNSNSLAITPRANKDALFDNDVYWTQIENGADVFTEPTSSPNGFRSDGPKGANCVSTEFENVPATTFGDWSKASGVDSQVGYGICTMTYGLVFDDNADVWGGEGAEEAKARTVKDYWENIVSNEAQAALFPNDYAKLPTPILNIARAGVASIDWQKGEGGGGGEEKPDDKKPPVVDPPKPPVVTPPSNAFSVTKKAISSSNGKATISLKLPGPGKVVMVGKAKVGKRTINVGKVTLNAAKSGTFSLTLNPSGAAKQALKNTGSLKVNLEITFTPTGGSAKASKTAVTLKLAKKG